MTATLQDPAEVVAGAMAAAFAPRERMDPAQWAERCRVVASGATPGPWDFARTPYLRGPHLAYGDPRTRQITVMKAEQIGGTELIFNCLMYAVDQRHGARLYVYPNIDIARKVNKDRLLPSMRATPRIAARMAEQRDGQTNLEQRFRDGSFVFFTGSNSDANLEVFSFRDVIIDELDRCVPGIVAKTRGRRKAHPDAKLLANGTPGDEGVGIDAEYADSDRCRWWTPCPACGAWHVRSDFRQVRWPCAPGRALEADPDTVEREAWYACPACDHAITAYEHRVTSERGVWLPVGYVVAGDGAHRLEAGATVGDHRLEAGATVGDHRLEAGATVGDHRLEAGATVGDHRLEAGATESPASCGEAPSCGGERLPEWCRRELERLGLAVRWRPDPRDFEHGAPECPPPPSTHAGFHVWGMMSTIVGNPFGEVAREFVERRGHPGREWANRRLGRAHRQLGARVEASHLRRLCRAVGDGGYRLQTAPRGVLVLTAAFDIQADRAYVEVAGWGEMGRGRWTVWHEEVPIDAEAGRMEAIRDVLKMRIASSDDPELSLPIGAAAIDSGRWTDHVYDLCQQLRREGFVVWPIKGDGGAQVINTLRIATIGEVTTIGRHKANRGELLVIKANAWKQSLLARIRGEEAVLEAERDGEADDPVQRFALPEDCGEEYLLQLTSEERTLKDVKGQPTFVFAPRPGMENRNHYWDCAVYNEALAMHVGVRELTESAVERIRARRRTGGRDLAPEQPRRFGGRGMLDRRRR